MTDRRTHLTIVALLVLVGTLAGHARTVRDFFVAAPIDELLTLNPTARQDLLDYHDNGQTVSAVNNMGSNAQLAWVDSMSIAIDTSEAQRVELLLLTRGRGDTALVVISTVDLPASDSRITCYDTGWRRLKPLLELPALDNFVKPTATARQRELLARVMPFDLVSAHIEGDNRDRIVARQHVKDFVAPDDYRLLQDALLDSITFDIPTLTKRINRRYVNTYL